MPEEEMTLATVAENLSDIEAEPGVDAMGESMTAQESDIFVDSLQEILDREGYDLQIVPRTEELQTEEVSLSPAQEFALDAELVGVLAAEDPDLARAITPVMPVSKAYRLDLDGVEYYAWFPSGSELVVTDDGYIYNESSANITGVISTTSDGVSLGSYNDFVTVAPLLTTGSNSNAYRYGSRVYITDYYPSGNNLVNTVSYVTSAKAVDVPGAGYGLSKYQILTVAFFVIVVFLLLIRGRKSV